MTTFHEILFLTCLFGLTFIFILPSVCENLGFSMYFISSKVNTVIIDNENDARVRKAKQTLNHLASGFPDENLTTKQLHAKKSGLDFAIVVVSVHRRSNPHYLLQTASRLMLEVKRDRGNSEIVIFNAERNPELNYDVNFLSRFVKVLNRSFPLVSDDIFAKEKQDYMEALQAGLQLNSRYVLVVQDDALSVSEILWKLRYILKWKMPWKWLKSGSQSWAFLKLYYPEKWQGFGNPEVPELILIGVLGTFCFTKVRKTVFKTQRNHVGNKLWWLWCVSGSLYFVLVAYTVGRAHWIEMRKILPLFYSVSTAPGCCIPAVLFPADNARDLVQFLNRTNCRKGYPIDFALDDFVKKNGLKGLLVSPNLFSHIGFHSSLHSFDKNPEEFRLLFDPWTL